MSVTLTGCVNFRTRQVILDDDICQWKACMVFQGVHARQVALTPNTNACPDTYYGCIDFETNTFEIIVPESCCAEPCGVCEQDTTPATLTIKISGVQTMDCYVKDFACPGDELFQGSVKADFDLASFINGTYELTQSEANSCRWTGGITPFGSPPSLDAPRILFYIRQQPGPTNCEITVSDNERFASVGIVAFRSSGFLTVTVTVSWFSGTVTAICFGNPLNGISFPMPVIKTVSNCLVEPAPGDGITAPGTEEDEPTEHLAFGGICTLTGQTGVPGT